VPIATAAGILTIGTPSDLSLDNPSKYPYEFQLSASPNELNLTALGYAQRQGAKKVAIIAAKDALGDSTVAAAKAGATKLGLSLVAEQYANTDLDITAPLQRLRATNPDFMLLEGFGAPVGYVLDSRLKLGWTDIPTLCITSCTVTALVVTSLVGAPAEQNVKMWIPSVQVRKPEASAAITTFLTALKAQGPITTSITAYSFQYDALMLLAAAAEQAKSIDTPAMTHALESLVQPAKPMWVDYGKYIYTAQAHSPQDVPASDYSAITPAHLVDGQVDAASTP
jgi:branched-chain amino acid transport system substrate-binding protein